MPTWELLQLPSPPSAALDKAGQCQGVQHGSDCPKAAPQLLAEFLKQNKTR